MPASADEENRSATADPLARTVADVLVRNALPGEIDRLDKDRLHAIAAFAAAAIAERPPGKPVVQVASGAESDGKRTSWVLVNTDDMPFLVDSATAAITARGLTMERLLHPVVDAVRTPEGRLRSIQPLEPDRAVAGQRESLIFIEMDRTAARNRAELAIEIEQVLDEVRRAVGGWKPILARLRSDTDRIADPQAKAFLEWLAADNFTFLGHAEFRADADSPRDGLGLLSETGVYGLADDRTAGRAALDALERPGLPVLVVRADRVARVHRRSRMNIVAAPLRDEEGRLTGVSCYAGHFTSQAMSAPPDDIPVLGERVARVGSALHFAPGGHAAKALVHVIGQLPRDLLFEMDEPCLRDIATTAMSLVDRPRPRAKTVRDTLRRFTNVLVWLPRDELSSQRRREIGDLATGLVDGVLDGWTSMMGEDPLVSLRYIIRHERNREIDEAALDAQLRDMIRGWNTAVEGALRSSVGATRAARLALTHGSAFSQSYRSQFEPEDAASDILRLAALSGREERDVRVYRRHDDKPGQLRLKVYRLREIIPLSDAVPVLEHFGFRVIEEYPFDLRDGRLGWIHDFLLEGRAADAFSPEANGRLESAIRAVLSGEAENDAFNALIAEVGLEPGSITLFRAWFRYMRQTGSAYGLQTVVDTLARYPGLTRSLVELFEAMHRPMEDAGQRQKRVEKAEAQIKTALTEVTAIDDDEILRRLLAIIRATVRSNAFVPGGPEALAIKLDSGAINWLPRPVPWREIFVYSPRVEGIHLRGGPVARGGIRWSDRRDDFRTEVLGLMKAQMVKNAVIVPTGAKGGFHPKHLPSPADRDAWLKEGTEAYRIYIRALLSLTDNIVDGAVVHPDHVVCGDGDDPYFVVAADKGTASFSDIANGIALERGFWLGDAFASGGSNGYDHKAMGITARGAWISVARHFAEIGVDVQTDPVTVAGVGDMSGDVFGNGMLLSKSIRLVAAFDHRHIFIDPDPDPAASWTERKRLFELPRSSWADYDTALISRGGGVFPRTQKEIPLSPEAKALLGVEADSLGPSALIGAVLKAQVDLLWFGGIGTYVKGASETNGQVGDRANDLHRVDGRDLRARVVGEGANLGVTQAGRIEYAARRGRINTDFIDNSAGVDCSDNEVNIKIALNAEVRAGKLALADRNALLEDMTEEVAALVLEDNRLQTLALSLAERDGAQALPSHQRVIQLLEASGRLDRAVEGLPDDEQLLSRLRDGRGLARPELAVLLAYAKLAVQDAIEGAGFAEDALLQPTLLAAFPRQMTERFQPAILAHRLRAEIVATELANRMVNRNGIVLPFALAEEEGCALGQVAAAYAVAESLFGLPRLWQAIEDAGLTADTELALFDATASGVRLHIADLVRTSPAGKNPEAICSELRPGVERVREQLDELLRDNTRSHLRALRDELLGASAPAPLVDRIVELHGLDGTIGVANLAARMGREGSEVALAKAYTIIGEALGVDWAKGAALALDPSDSWDRLLLAGLVRDFEQFRLDLLGRIAGQTGSPEKAVETWLSDHAQRVDQFRALVSRARAQPVITPAILAQVASQARVLLAR